LPILINHLLSMKDLPVVSVIIPLYNKEETIRKTVESVLNQSYADFELLVVDDGSTDNSLKILSEINDERLIIISKPNGGVSHARNYGVRNAKSEFIFFLDADDLITSNCLSIFASLLSKYKNESVFVSNFKIIQTNSEEIVYCKSNKEFLYKKPIKALWGKKIFPRTGAMMIKKECFDNIGYFNNDIVIYEDLEFILRLLNKYNVVYTPLVVMTYQREFNSLSKKVVPLNKEFCYHISLKNKSFFEKLILIENTYYSYRNRIKARDWDSVNYLKTRLVTYLPYSITAIVYKKTLNLAYGLFK
jgi:glycosyltransferase involved in cell wall biosynthesis